ncbi:Alpha-xylosidase 1 [Linum grandiflorum]
MFSSMSLPMLHFLFLLCFLLGVISITSSSKIGSGYRLISIGQTPDGGLLGQLQVKHPNEIYGPDIPLLHLFVKNIQFVLFIYRHETEDRLRVHITDAEKQRWEVPYNLLPRDQPPSPTSTNNLQNGAVQESFSSGELIFNYTEDPFSFTVTRKSSGQTLFSSGSEESDPFGTMVFKDQYLEISTKLPPEASLYGLGESTRPSGIKLRSGESYTLYTTDNSATHLNMNLYGSHPVYMDLRNLKGKAYAHGVLLLNSNGMDVFYSGSSLTYKVIGGVFDFYFFAGPTPLSVVDQYTSLIGRPAPMPYWAFGFHQCKFGYHNISMVEQVVDNYRKAKIPLDVIWNDDDHMDFQKDFTLSPINYPLKNVTLFLDKIHSIGMKYIVLIDPGINVNSTYGVYQRALADDVFIKYDEQPFLAQVWPGPVHFPDFLNPKTVSWWADEIRRFHDMVPVDGLWIDMNEVANFCTGLTTVNNKSKWDDPPYKINLRNTQAPLGLGTIAASAVHYDGVLEYDAHSLYGFSQAVATHKALQGLQGKRPFILSRSTFVGSGKYVAHWSGDNEANWENLNYSISTMLNFGIFGVPMVGSDICGFFSAPTEELCSRWIELGAFYPFSRDHSDFYSPGKELYRWESVAESARNALGLRYKLLPYLYTLNYEAHTTGAPIARPLFFSFPNYNECYGLSTQFLVGGSVMVSPVLEEGKTQVNALFPPGSWYNMFNMSQGVRSKGEYFTLEAPLHVINVHVYENTIVPMQRGGMVSKDARMTPFSLIVAFPARATKNGEAKGCLFLDNDELPEMKLGNGESSYIDFYANVSNGYVTLWSEVREGTFVSGKGLTIEKVTALGLGGSGGPYDVQIHGNTTVSNVEVRSSEQMLIESGDVDEKAKSMMVEVSGLEIPLGINFVITWHMKL